MPSSSEKQRRFMGAELSRKRKGMKTKTGMSEKQLGDYASKVQAGPSMKGKGKSKKARGKKSK